MSPNAPADAEVALAGSASPATVARKADHIRINLEEDVSAKGVASGFDEPGRYTLRPPRCMSYT